MNTLHQEYLQWLQRNRRGVTASGEEVTLTLSTCEALDLFEQNCDAVQHQLEHDLTETARMIMRIARHRFDLALKRQNIVRIVKV